MKKKIAFAGRKRLASQSKEPMRKVPSWSVAWIALVVMLHYLFSYLFDPKYSAFIEKIISKMFG